MQCLQMAGWWLGGLLGMTEHRVDWSPLKEPLCWVDGVPTKDKEVQILINSTKKL